MLRAARATTKPTEFSPLVFFGAGTNAKTKGVASRSLGCSHPFSANHRPHATANNLRPAYSTTVNHVGCGGAALTTPSYRAPTKPLAARSPLSPMRPPIPAEHTANPRPRVHELHIQLAGAKFSCGQDPRDIQTSLAADRLPGHLYRDNQEHAAGDLSCARVIPANHSPGGTRPFRAHLFGEAQNQTGAVTFPANPISHPTTLAPGKSSRRNKHKQGSSQ